MVQKPNWLPPRHGDELTDNKWQSDEGTPGIVSLLIRKLAHGEWPALARLLQLACRTLDLAPGLAHKWAEAGTTGIVLDVLYQAPRHHPSWRLLSTAGAGLLAALVRCEGSTEAAQPQALRMLLSMLERDTTCGPARQAVATVLHCLVAQRTVHRDKLLAAGALPTVLRVLRRLDVLCDLIAVQELLWLVAYLTEDGAAPLGGAGAGPGDAELQAGVVAQLVPLLFLYGMPAHAQHAHLAALTIRALHVQVAGHDEGKDGLRAAGTLPVLVDLVRRHSAPYVAAAAALAGGSAGCGGNGAGGAGVASSVGHEAAHASDGHQQGQDLWHSARARSLQRVVAHGSLQFGPVRPPPHEGCDVHAECAAALHHAPGGGPYGQDPAAALGPWTPWQRLLAVLLICGMVPGLVPAPKQRRTRGAALAASASAADPGPSTCASGDPNGTGGSATPSPIASDAEDEEQEEGQVAAEAQQAAGVDAAEAADPAGGVIDAATVPADPWVALVTDGARLACCGLLLPLLVDAGNEAAAGIGGGAGGGSGAAALGGALLRRRLCPLRESLATLKTLMCDCEANQALAGELGLVPLLVQLVAHGDMGLAWQAAEAAVFLSSGATGAALVAVGAVEELAYLLQESAEALHGLTLRKQILVQTSSLASADTHSHAGHGRRPARTSHSGGASVAVTLASVHVRPCPEPPVSRPQRLYLVGRLPLDFTTSSACFYGSHDAASYCDYCTPSAAIKALLRLLTAPAVSAGRSHASGDGTGDGEEEKEEEEEAAGAGAEAAVCRRFSASGGLYGVLQLLHHEAAGVHHSKLAASLLTLMDCVLRHDPGAQDELRAAGGLGVLAALLESLLRPGVMDVYQLRVAACRTLRLALEGNAANKLAAREHGLLPLLVSMMTGIAERRKASSGELVLDDDGFLSTAVLDTLATAAHDSPGTQDALVALGLMHPVCQFVRDERLEAEVRTSAVRALGAVVAGRPEAQRGALALDVVKPAVAWLARCCSAGNAGRAHRGGGAAAAAPRPAEATACAELSLAMLALLAALLSGGSGGGSSGSGVPASASASVAKSAVVSAGALPVLLDILRNPVAAITADAFAASAYAGATAHGAAATQLAAGLLAALADGDVDLQNELVSQGALTVAAGIIRDGGAAAPQALQLLSSMLCSNTFAKNTARGAGLPVTLVAAARRAGLQRAAAAAAAVGALSELAAGNHANQEAVAVEGGLEVAVELSRDACGVLPFGVLRSGTATDEEGAPSGRLSGYGDGYGGSNGALAGNGAERAEESGAPGDAAAANAAAEAAEEAVTLSRLLRALFGLLRACAELNSRNQSYVRELGGVGLLGDFLTTASEALTAPLPPTQLQRPGHQEQAAVAAVTAGQRPRLAHGTEGEARLRSAVVAARAALSPAVAAACGATAALVRDCSANLERLEEHTRLPLALFKLLVATDAATSCAAAHAIEWLVVRNSTQLNAPSREAFELNLMDLLALALYVPYGPVHHAHKTVTSGHDGFGHATTQHQQQRDQQQQALLHGPWHMAVTALMPAEGLTATAVRDAVAVLTAVADAADSLAGGAAQQPQPQHATAKAQPAKAAASKQPRAPLGSLPTLEPAPLAPVATDHASGLVLSSTLSGRTSLSGPNSQARWAELAGSAATAFQRVANGPLRQAAPATAPTASVGAGGGVGAAWEAAQERRRQVAWMIFLLAAHSPENRARVRQLVRTSLTPLAQQLANAEACRAQLEAASVLAPGASALRPVSSSAGQAAAAVASMSSAALESASSFNGPLPISTPALVVPGPGSPQVRRAPPTITQDFEASPPYSGKVPSAVEADLVSRALQHDQQRQPSFRSAQASAGPSGGQAGGYSLPQVPAPSAPAVTTPPPSIPIAAASPLVGAAPPTSATRQAGGGTALYGNLYGPPTTRPPTPPASVTPTPRDTYVSAAAAGPSSANSTPLHSLPPDPISIRWGAGGRHSRTGSGSFAVGPSAALLTASGGSGSATPRLSLSGAAAAAFASPAPGPYLVAAQQGHGSRGPSPSGRRAALLRSPGDKGVSVASGFRPAAVAGSTLPYASASPSGGYAAAAAAAQAARAGASARSLHAQISGGGSSVMSDDDELTMIQQEVALLATTTSSLAGNGTRSGTPSAAARQSSTPSPARWGHARG